MKPISEKSLVVLNYLKEIGDTNVTAADIGEAIGISTKSVDGTVTSGLIKNRGLAERVPAQIEVTDDEGNTKYKDVKFIRLTDAGKAYDHEAALATAAKEAE